MNDELQRRALMMAAFTQWLGWDEVAEACERLASGYDLAASLQLTLTAPMRLSKWAPPDDDGDMDAAGASMMQLHWELLAVSRVAHGLPPYKERTVQ